MQNRIPALVQWIKTHENDFFDFVRIYLGIGLFVKAIYFMLHRDYLFALMQDAGTLWFAPAVVIHYVIPAHLIGGFLLTIGLLTRLAALAQIPILVGAVFYIHLPKMVSMEPRQNLEFSALVLFLIVLIFLRGAGRYSVDWHLSEKKNG